MTPQEANSLKLVVQQFADDIRLKGFKEAVTAGGAVIARSYRSILESVTKKPGDPSFMIAYKAVGVKVAELKNGAGVYAVIGTKRKGGYRLAPHVLFGERGTKKTTTKSGANRGIMPVQHWLERARAESYDAAVQVMMKKLAEYASKH